MNIKGFIKNNYTGRDVIVALQHMLTMMGATILVPLSCGMNVSLAMICAGIGTICFFFISKKKVPVFLGSSFAFLSAYISIMGSNIDPSRGETVTNLFTTNYELWCTNMGKLAVSLWFAGLLYVLFAGLIKIIGPHKIKKFFGPVVVGPIVILIGLTLCQTIMQSNIWSQIAGNEYSGTVGVVSWKVWTTAIITMITIIAINAYTKPKSILRIMPIIIGFIVGTVYALIIGYPMPKIEVNSIIIFQDIFSKNSALGFWKHLSISGNALLQILPIALVSIMEHIGDISANGIVCGKDFFAEPGVHRTLLGDGVATAFAGLLGGPSNTTYSENTAVLVMTKNYKPTTLLLAGIFAVILGMFVPFATIMYAIPKPVIGGASVVLFGMIAISGLRSLVDNKINLSETKNLLCVSLTLATGMAFSVIGGLPVGGMQVSALCIATIVAVVLNLIIPDKKEFSTGVGLQTKTTAENIENNNTEDKELNN